MAEPEITPPQSYYPNFFKSTNFPGIIFTWIYGLGKERVAALGKLFRDDFDPQKEILCEIRYPADGEYTCLGHTANQDTILKELLGGKVLAAGSCEKCPYRE